MGLEPGFSDSSQCSLPSGWPCPITLRILTTLHFLYTKKPSDTRRQRRCVSQELNGNYLQSSELALGRELRKEAVYKDKTSV